MNAFDVLPEVSKLSATVEDALVDAFGLEAMDAKSANKALGEIASFAHVRESYLAWLADAHLGLTKCEGCLKSKFDPKTWLSGAKADLVEEESMRQMKAAALPPDQIAAKKILTDPSTSATLPDTTDTAKWNSLSSTLSKKPGYEGLDVNKGVLTIKKDKPAW